jgi:ATP-binding cassette, subfamily B, heavy metal transporter
MLDRIPKFFSFINPYIWGKNSNITRVSVGLLLDVLDSVIKVVLPMLVADKFIGEDNFKLTEAEAPLLSIVAGTFVVANLLPTVRSYLLSSIRSDMQAMVSEDMLRSTYKMELDEHLSAPTGQFAQLLTTVYTSAEEVVPSLYGELLPTSFALGATTVGIFIINWPAGLIEIGALIAYVISSAYNAHRSGIVSEERLIAVYGAYAGLLSAIDRYQVAHQFGNVEHEIKRARAALLVQKNAYTNSHRQKVTNEFRNNVIAILGMAGIMAYVAINYINSKATLQDFVLIGYFMTILNTSLRKLGNAMEKIHIASIECEKIIDFIKAKSDLEDISGAHQFEVTTPPKIEFRNIYFSYKSEESQKSLEDISFVIKPGQKIAVVGDSGSGKSTLIKLLLRFYTQSSGEIFVNGQDIRLLSADSLRSEISVVSQNPNLFQGTIADNIAYGDMKASWATLNEVAKYAGLDEWLYQESGRTLDEDIGANGDKISGGQKQRVAIARALLKSGLVFLLDEATSALDIATEKEILDRVDNLTVNNTVLIVTHRLTSIVNADRIIYMKKGRILEQGTFVELMGKEGAFYNQIGIECAKLGISVQSINHIPRHKDDLDHNLMSFFCEKRRTDRLNSKTVNLTGEDYVSYNVDNMMNTSLLNHDY